MNHNTMSVIETVAAYPSLDQSATVLDLDKNELRDLLLRLGVKHELGARWQQDCKDFLAADMRYQYDMFGDLSIVVPKRKPFKPKVEVLIKPMYDRIDHSIEFDLENSI